MQCPKCEERTWTTLMVGGGYLAVFKCSSCSFSVTSRWKGESKFEADMKALVKEKSNARNETDRGN